MKIFKGIIRGIIILSVIGGIAFVILVGEYHIYYKRAEYTAVKHGVVVYSHESIGRYLSSCYLATVRFENGDVQQVNTGDRFYEIGSKFSSQLSWNPITGISGLAYGWNPSPEIAIMLYSFAAMFFNIAVVGYLVVRIIRFAFK